MTPIIFLPTVTRLCWRDISGSVVMHRNTYTKHNLTKTSSIREGPATRSTLKSLWTLLFSSWLNESGNTPLHVSTCEHTRLACWDKPISFEFRNLLQNFMVPLKKKKINSMRFLVFERFQVSLFWKMGTSALAFSRMWSDEDGRAPTI